MKKIALLSPSQNAFSETFIQAHKNSLKGDIKYYYHGVPPEYLEGVGRINPYYLKIPNFIIGKILNNEIYDEQFALKKSLKKEKIDLVFAEYGNMGNAVIDACENLNLPLITHFHGADIFKHDNVVQANNYQKVFEFSNKIISVSTLMTNKMLELGCSEDKIIYSPCGPHDRFYSVHPKFQTKDFLFVGRFVEKKSPLTLIKSFELVLQLVDDAKLIMVGNGPLLNECIKYVKENNLDKNIEFKGVLDHTKIMQLMESALAYVQHSVTGVNGDKEGTPVSVSEASLAGLPVVSTFHSGIQDVILHGETGFLTPEFDINLTSKYMIELLENPDLAKRMGKKGKERINNYFSMKIHISKLNDAIDSTLQNKYYK